MTRSGLLNLKTLAPTVLAGSLILGGPVLEAGASEAAPNGDWSFDVVPYLWLATYDGTLDVPGTAVDAASRGTESAGPYSTSVSAAAMLSAQIRYRNVGLLLDGAWLQLETEGDSAGNLYTWTDIQTDISYGMGALAYHLPAVGRLQSQVFAGARVWYTSHEIEFQGGTQPGFTRDDSRTWTDPIVGAGFRYGLGKGFHAAVLGDMGGFGVGSDLAWSVYGGVGYHFADWFSTSLGYRYLHMDFEDGGFVADLNVQGFLLGFGFHF